MSLIVNSNIDSVRLYRPAAKKVQADLQSTASSESQHQPYIRADANTLLNLTKQNPFNESHSTIYDQPTQKMSAAIQVYKTLANLDRREEIQQLVGVDIYA